jgi:hypothetical protein
MKRVIALLAVCCLVGCQPTPTPTPDPTPASVDNHWVALISHEAAVAALPDTTAVVPEPAPDDDAGSSPPPVVVESAGNERAGCSGGSCGVQRGLFRRWR